MCSVRSGAGRRQGGTGVRTERLRVQVRCVLRPRLVGGMVKDYKEGAHGGDRARRMGGRSAREGARCRWGGGRRRRAGRVGTGCRGGATGVGLSPRG